MAECRYCGRYTKEGEHICSECCKKRIKVRELLGTAKMIKETSILDRDFTKALYNDGKKEIENKAIDKLQNLITVIQDNFGVDNVASSIAEAEIALSYLKRLYKCTTRVKSMKFKMLNISEEEEK